MVDKPETPAVILNALAGHDCLESGVKAPLRRLGERLGAIRAKAAAIQGLADELGALRLDLDRALGRLDEASGATLAPVMVEPVDVAALLENIAAVLQPAMRRSGHDLQAGYLSTFGGQIYTDSLKLRRLVYELVGHAWTQMAAGGAIKLDVAADAACLSLMVDEIGATLSDDELTALKAGVPTDAALARLCVLAQALGGRVEAVCSPLGLRVSALLPADLRSVSKGKSAASATGRGAATVLLVDVDTVVHELLGEALPRDSFRLIHAFDESQGFELASELVPDIIVVNVLCPGMDGWGLLSRLKNAETVRHVPVVVLTLADEEEAGYLLRASDSITKPFRFEALLETVNRYRPLEGEASALVIEDDDVTRTILCRLLERDGWRVVGAANGFDGLQQIGRARPSMVLLDLMMPGMDGFEFLKLMRMTERPGDHAPVIVVTAKDLNDDEQGWLSGTTRRDGCHDGMACSQLVQSVRDWVTHATARGTIVI